MQTITKSDIIKGLKELGIQEKWTVLVHSSLSSFGFVEGGPSAVVEALLASVGEGGNIVVPTLTGTDKDSKINPPVFDSKNSKCYTGAIPEYFRKRTDAIRSLHPTHSVAVIGPSATSLTKDHLYSITPCDTQSPFGKIAMEDNAYILLIGVSHSSNTMFHHVEEIAGADYHMQPDLIQASIIVNDIETPYHYMLHRWGAPRNFEVMEPVFIERGIQVEGKIGNSTVKLINVRRMVDITYKCLLTNKNILLVQS